MRNIFFVCFLVSCFSSFSFAASTLRDCQNTQDCLYELKSPADFQKLAYSLNPQDESTTVVKIVYWKNPQGESRVYFVNTKVFEFHFDFVQNSLLEKRSLSQFNSNYTGDGTQREFNLVSLISDQQTLPGTLLLELWTGDEMLAPSLKQLIDAIKSKISIPMMFHPLSRDQEKRFQNADLGVKTITNAQLFGNKKYFALNKGEAYGKLVFADDQAPATTCLDVRTIAVYKKAPNDIGLLGGVITLDYQTPLSHINVKSMNRGTANMALLEGESQLRKWQNKFVHLVVNGDKFEISEISPSSAASTIRRFWDTRRPKTKVEIQNFSASPNPQFMPFNKLFTSAPQKALHTRAVNLYGAKSTNISLIGNFLREITPAQGLSSLVFSPEGYAIPFDYYDRFIHLPQTSLGGKNLATYIESKLGSAGLLRADILHTACEAKAVLEDIRNQYDKAELPLELINDFRKYIFQEPNSSIHISKIPRLRMRSSTNSEDLEGFSGAGLYESDGVSFYKKNDRGFFLQEQPLSEEKILEKLAKSIKFIYGAVWNDRAFEEREWYGLNGVNHLKVRVGLATHNAFPGKGFAGQVGERANGVSVLKNIYKLTEEDKVYINSQFGDFAVTNPPTNDEIAESSDLYSVPLDKPYKTEEILVTSFVANESENFKKDSWKKWSYEVLSESSVVPKDTSQKKVLNQQNPGANGDEVRLLAKVMKELNYRFAKVYQKDPNEFSLDVEWKIYGPQRNLWIKQARPFDPTQVQSTSADKPNGIAAFAPSASAAKIRRPGTNLGPQRP